MPASRRASHAEQRQRIQPSSSSSPPPLLSSLTSASTSAPFLPPPETTTIVLVHGLGRTPRSMARLASRLEKATGLRAVSIGYPSRRLSVAEAAAVVSAKAAEACGGAGRPAFAVTFSLGGPIIRHAASLQRKGTDEAGEEWYGGPDWRGSVLLAPPNRGSDLARALLHSPSTPGFVRKLFRFAYGPAVDDLALSPEEIARAWPDAPRPCGIIAGTAPWSFNPASLLLAARIFGSSGSARSKSKGDGDGRRVARRAHDGTVAVDETRLQSPADDFATVHAGHTFIAESKETAELVAAFVTEGKFFLKDPEARGLSL